MSATTEHPRDDAPIVASKTIDPARALIAETVTIARPAAELYAAWRDPAQLVRFMDNIVSIEPLGDDRTRWTVKAPMGRTLIWDMIVTHHVPDREISWQAAEGGDLPNAGKISFADAGARGTVVRITIAYDPPGGMIGQWFAKLFQREPRIQTRRDLHRFKQLMETGEVATSARNARIHRERYGDHGQTAGAAA